MAEQHSGIFRGPSPADASMRISMDDLIQLPRFDAAGAVALGEKLMTVANAEPDLPRAIKRAKEALGECLVALRSAAEARLAARMAAASATDPEVVSDADATLDACWTALHDWLTGFSKLPPAHAEHGEASALLAELYPDGLGFILLPYALEWGQSDLRLGRIASETLGERIRKLGGAVFIDALQAAHWQYGQLLGLPRVPGEGEPDKPSTREALEGFASTLRVYALKVTAHVEVDEPETGALSKRLLEPLLGWQVTPRAPGEPDRTLV
jgi:hypothetical protein